MTALPSKNEQEQLTVRTASPSRDKRCAGQTPYHGWAIRPLCAIVTMNFPMQESRTREALQEEDHGNTFAWIGGKRHTTLARLVNPGTMRQLTRSG